MSSDRTEQTVPPDAGRRRFLQWLPSLAMGGGLLAAYGTFAAYLGRFLYPARGLDRGWLFVREVKRLNTGEALAYRLPNGSPVNITRQGTTSTAEDFIALSSTCPHLGCRVHWEPQNDRFFCPCHNGIFTPEGKAIGGPPGDAGQYLPQYPLKVAGGLLYIQVPLDVAALGPGTVEDPAVAAKTPSGPGHDPCLRRGIRKPTERRV